jgi:hypothetical protein
MPFANPLSVRGCADGDHSLICTAFAGCSGATASHSAENCLDEQAARGVVVCEFREGGPQPSVRVTGQDDREVEYTHRLACGMDVLHTAQRVQKASYQAPLVPSSALVVDRAP